MSSLLCSQVRVFLFPPIPFSCKEHACQGNTWNFRDDLERAGISGSRTENNGYYRFLKNVDVTDRDGKQKVMSVVDILHKQACRVVVDPAPEPDTPVAIFLDELRAIDCLHFDE